MDKKGVTYFWRVWEHVWPQWHRLVVVVVSALLIGILFSLSFATIIPLLKVMTGEEGLHSWVDRKSCDLRYGMDFYVPDKADFMGSNANIAFYLLVNHIEEDGQAQKAGLRPQDRIVDVAGYGAGLGNERVPASKLLELLAGAADGTNLSVKVICVDDQDMQPVLINLETPKHPDNITPEEMGFLKRVEWGFKWAVVNRAQWATSFLSRDDTGSKQKSVVFIILAMAVVTTIRCAATFWQKYMTEKVVQISIAELRGKVFSHVMFMPVGFFATEGTSDTISRILGDTASVGKGVKVLLGKALREPLKALFCLIGAMIISWQLTLIFLGAAPITIGLLGLLGKKMKRATRRSLMASAVMLGRLQDSVSALRVVKVYNRQECEVESFNGVNRQLLRRGIKIAKIEAGTGPIMEVLGMVAGSAALLVGAHWVCRVENSMDASAFFGLLLFLGSAAESIRKVSDVWNRIQEANAAAERVYEIVDGAAEPEKPDAFELAPLREQIEFRDIVFTYPKSDRPVLNGVDISIRAGQTVAVVGPNGSGKTTLINLIPRFYDPDSGRILIDGKDIGDATLRSLRDQIGMVTQNVVTFNDTVAANIGYGKHDATMEDIVEAAQRAYAHEFIEPLPGGYDTVIGEHSSGFSGGQLQRIVIARAIIKNPPILIFDEAMSQIDADSEAKINDALSGLMEGRTCFVIAHRFSTIVNADLIVVMDGGQIIAQGTHGELMKSCQLYQSLYETQFTIT